MAGRHRTNEAVDAGGAPEMIYGIGTDIVAIGRMEAMLKRYGDRAVAKLLAATERERSGWACAIRQRFTASRSRTTRWEDPGSILRRHSPAGCRRGN